MDVAWKIRAIMPRVSGLRTRSCNREFVKSVD